MQLLIDNKTWKLVELYWNQEMIDSNWMYKLKDNLVEDDA